MLFHLHKFRIVFWSDEIKQHLVFRLLILEVAGACMEFEVKTNVSRHKLKRLIDGHCDAVNQTSLVCLGVYLEHPSEGRIAVGTATVSKGGVETRDVVIQEYHLHLIFEHIHYLFEWKRCSNGEDDERIVLVIYRLLHRVCVHKFRQLERHRRNKVVVKVLQHNLFCVSWGDYNRVK